MRYEWIDNTDFGSGPQDTGGYLLTRFLPYAALTLPKLIGDLELQLFGQAEAAFSDYDARGPGPIDEDAFDMCRHLPRLLYPAGKGRANHSGRASDDFLWDGACVGYPLWTECSS